MGILLVVSVPVIRDRFIHLFTATSIAAWVLNSSLAHIKLVINRNSQIFSTKSVAKQHLSLLTCIAGCFQVLERDGHQTPAFSSFPPEPASPAARPAEGSGLSQDEGSGKLVVSGAGFPHGCSGPALPSQIRHITITVTDAEVVSGVPDTGPATR